MIDLPSLLIGLGIGLPLGVLVDRLLRPAVDRWAVVARRER